MTETDRVFIHRTKQCN